MRLYIADDSAIIRSRLISMISEIEGIEIVGEGETLPEVMRDVNGLHPDVLILDIRMPDVDGILALEQIKQDEKPPIIIMFTNYPYLQYRKRCLEAGADFFFYKAVEFEDLIAMLRKLAKIS